MATAAAVFFLPLYASWECAWDSRAGNDQEYSTDRMISGETSPAKLGALFLLKGYQVFISPNISSSCNFYPSCSRYSSDCISRYGVIKGCIMTFDRLIRCNGSARFAPYKWSDKKGLLYDPPGDDSLLEPLFNWLDF